MSDFLSPSEITQILDDFDNLLASAEASTVTVRWITGHSLPYDDGYKQYPAGDVPTWQTQNMKCIYQVITGLGPLDKSYVDSGILRVGDVILYMARNYDLTGKESMEFVFNNRTIYPKINQGNFTDYVAVPLGNQQVCQMIACTQVKEKE